MKLKQLLKAIAGVEIKGNQNLQITGISSDSRRVSPGNLFIARKGQSFDGNQFIDQAEEGGASAILTDLYDPTRKGVTQLIHPNPQELEAVLAATYYQDPSKELYMVGVTGTNGKSTTCYLVRHIFESAGIRTGMIGTIEYSLGNKSYPSSHSTPDVVTCHRLLREMRRADCEACVMEVTSHGLDQGRVDLVDFDVGVFTNIEREHLDYHETMDHYIGAKQKLFDRVPIGVVNGDDPVKMRVEEQLVFGENQQLSFEIEALSTESARVTFGYEGEKVSVALPLIGRFNVYNAAAAIGIGICKGIPFKEGCQALESFDAVPGRLQRIGWDGRFTVLVDYAHTPRAYEAIFQELCPAVKGRVIVVFGCGGDRDQERRSKFGQICGKWADISFVTNDNPRTEAPEKIIEAIVAGMPKRAHYRVIPDRREAIEAACQEAKEGDLVLLLGKGHERSQQMASGNLPWNEVQIAREVLGGICATHSSLS